MNLRYERNIIHIDAHEQNRIRDFSVLIAGCGIGSYIAECLLRMGFENLTIMDGDKVELTNLNRQNYVEKDIGINKAIALKERLMAINSDAHITAYTEFIDQDNLRNIGSEYKAVINALDFSSDMPFVLDEYMTQRNIPIVHPYNLGWAGFLTVITGGSQTLRSLGKRQVAFEINVGAFILDSLKSKNIECGWLEDFLSQYGKIANQSPPPQLSTGLSILAGMVCHVLFNMATGKPFKVFPDSYYLSMFE